MNRITSRSNPLVARFREAARHAVPDLLLDGPHLIETALALGVPLDVAAWRAPTDPQEPDEVARLAARLERAGTLVSAVSPAVMDAMSPVRTPTGLVALAQRPATDRARLLAPSPALVLVAAGVQDPGNLGAIVRVADAAGATGVIATAGSADAFGWKALRGSMGSALRLPIWSRAPWAEVSEWLASHALRVLAAAAGDGTSFLDVGWDVPTAVLLGGEGRGLPAELHDPSHERVTVPMRSGVESLNVAVTAALIAYQARRCGPAPARRQTGSE